MSDENSPRKTAIIIGAGIGGTSTAARLAKAGFEVTVIEKNDWTGGRCSLIHHNGYRFDRGPSLLLLPDMFREAFADLDTSLEDEGVDLLKCEPNYHVWFGDGELFELSSDLAKMKEQIEKWEGKDGFERYFGFMKEAHRHYEISVKHVLKKNFTSLLSMLRPSFLPHLLTLHPFESIYTRASRYFWTDRLRRVFTFGSMYMGMSPFDAPGTYSLLQYTELAEGIWYPVGGFHRVVEAMVDVGERLGVKYRFSTPVSSIKLTSSSSSAVGVVLENGEELLADTVVCNADLVYAYNNLLPPTPYAKSLASRPGSCSSISFYWALDRVIPELRAHNIFLADDYRESFDQIFKDQSLPLEPSFYVNVPSRIDPTAAPPGRDSVVVLVPIGHLLSRQEGRGINPRTEQDWQGLIAKARNAVLDTVEQRTGCVSLRSCIIHESINTPQTWQDTLNLDKGAILGLSHSFLNVLSFRPKTRHPTIKNLYFVGASTHPGTGVPIVLAGSKITSEQILGDSKLPIPWTASSSSSSSSLASLSKHSSPTVSGGSGAVSSASVKPRSQKSKNLDKERPWNPLFDLNVYFELGTFVIFAIIAAAASVLLALALTNFGAQQLQKSQQEQQRQQQLQQQQQQQQSSESLFARLMSFLP